MPDPYPIIEVKPEWIVNPEDMGTKKKVWYHEPGNKTKWLFKHPRPNTGEHWAEKIAAEVASGIGVNHAKVELAEFQDTRGSVTESFARGGRILWHGNQILEIAIGGYSLEKEFRSSQHTLENILKVMKNFFVKPETARRAEQTIAEYMVLDALIGNTDRHHENWGILAQRKSNDWGMFVAPSFDHASSLGRELLDKRRNQYLEENRIGDYVEKGRGAIYWTENEHRAPSPLELVRRATHKYPEFFHSIGMKLAKIDEHIFEQRVNQIPSDWMSQSERKFAIALMRYNYAQLLEAIP